MTEKERIEKEIEELEKKLQNDHFGGIFDKGGRKKQENKLKKLKKSLAELTKNKK
jgi:hypothetical protein